jgi:hypothetical protein
MALAREIQLHGSKSAADKAVESEDISPLTSQQLLDESSQQSASISGHLYSVLLQSALQAEKTHSAKLANELEAERVHVRKLFEELNVAKQQLKQLYQKLRAERHRRQRGESCKSILDQQIALLKSIDLKEDQDIKELSANVSTAVNALVNVKKDNSNLCSELSQALEQCTMRAKLHKGKLTQVFNNLKSSRQQVSMLKKHCNHAVSVKQRAINSVKEKVKREMGVHSLLHKGVYTSHTRNLVQLLVKAGCSREYVSEVIHAVFKTAGISVVGEISRRSVSRIITEGFYAAQMQLGHEMTQSESKLSCSTYIYCISILIKLLLRYDSQS